MPIRFLGHLVALGKSLLVLRSLIPVEILNFYWWGTLQSEGIHWLILDMLSYRISITSYLMRCKTTSHHKHHKVLASNDGIEWNPINDVSIETQPTSEEQVFHVSSNKVFYRFLKFVTDGDRYDGGFSFGLSYLRLYGTIKNSVPYNCITYRKNKNYNYINLFVLGILK